MPTAAEIGITLRTPESSCLPVEARSFSRTSTSCSAVAQFTGLDRFAFDSSEIVGSGDRFLRSAHPATAKTQRAAPRIVSCDFSEFISLPLLDVLRFHTPTDHFVSLFVQAPLDESLV